MNNMDVPEAKWGAQAAQIFAEYLHRSWGVGDAACQNGVLLLLAIADRQIYISVASGADGEQKAYRHGYVY